jgi:hypothetical protein
MPTHFQWGGHKNPGQNDAVINGTTELFAYHFSYMPIITSARSGGYATDQSVCVCVCMRLCAQNNSKILSLNFKKLNVWKMFILIQARTLLILVTIHGELHDKQNENNILARYRFIIF